MFEHCHVVGGKYSLPASQSVAASSASAGATRWIGLRARCGYAMWPCTPLTIERAGQRPAAAVLDHVAEQRRPTRARRRCSSRCARRAPQAARRPCTVPSTEGPSSSDVMSSAIEPRARGCRATKRFDRHDECGERGLHVRGAAAVEVAVAHRSGTKGSRVPRFQRPGGHHVGVAGEAHERRARAAPRPQVGHAVAMIVSHAKPERRQARARAPGSPRRRA